jgi:hypothetical protein
MVGRMGDVFSSGINLQPAALGGPNPTGDATEDPELDRTFVLSDAEHKNRNRPYSTPHS